MAGKVIFSEEPQDTRVFDVGDRVEVYCDHDDDQGERIKGWLVGVVVQANDKMVAVQFQRNVYLTNGWMVPDRVLWCPQNARQIRPVPRRRRR